jgi:hypothetical protein
VLGGGPGGPFGGFAEVGELGGDVGANGVLKRDDVVEDAEGVLAHFLASKEFGRGGGEVEAELDGAGRDGDADVVVGQEQAAIAAGDGATGIEEPGLGTGGVNVQELEELLFEMPQAQETVLADADGAEKDNRFEESEVGVGVAGSIRNREFESGLEAGDYNRGAV